MLSDFLGLLFSLSYELLTINDADRHKFGFKFWLAIIIDGLYLFFFMLLAICAIALILSLIDKFVWLIALIVLLLLGGTGYFGFYCCRLTGQLINYFLFPRNHLKM